MIIPEFWAEARLQHKTHRRQITVKRFGWSDISQEGAQAMADQRAADALRRIEAGEPLTRREIKASYGVEGMPIREEVLARLGSVVITRNLYGSACLNTPNVLFVDVDHDLRPRFSLTCGQLLILLAGSAGYAWYVGSPRAFFFALLVCAIVSWAVIRLLNALHRRFSESPSNAALRRIREFSEAHPDWHLRVYETPAGCRVLVMHDVFEPNSEPVRECFRAFGADPVYAQMCELQGCFRARVSPKPWRTGFEEQLRPKPGVWPVKPEYLPGRRKWVRDYEEKAAGHASCRFVRTFGSSRTHPEAEAVRILHDRLCRTESGLPLA